MVGKYFWKFSLSTILSKNFFLISEILLFPKKNISKNFLFLLFPVLQECQTDSEELIYQARAPSSCSAPPDLLITSDPDSKIMKNGRKSPCRNNKNNKTRKNSPERNRKESNTENSNNDSEDRVRLEVSELVTLL